MDVEEGGRGKHRHIKNSYLSDAVVVILYIWNTCGCTYIYSQIIIPDAKETFQSVLILSKLFQKENCALSSFFLYHCKNRSCFFSSFSQTFYCTWV